MSVGWCGLFGDSVLAYDPLLGRSTTFTPDGGVETAQASAPQTSLGSPSRGWIARFTDGSMLAGPHTFGASQDERPWGTVDTQLFRVAPAGQLAEEIGRFRHFEFAKLRGGATVPALFGAKLGAARTSDDRLVITFGRQYSFEVVGSDGTLQQIVHRRWKPRPITDADLSFAVRASGGRNPSRALDILRARTVSDDFPAYDSRVFVDLQDRVWLSDYPDPQDPIVAWSVFDDSGRWMREVRLPTGFEPREVGSRWVLGVLRDPISGLRSVVRFDLEDVPEPDYPSR